VLLTGANGGKIGDEPLSLKETLCTEKKGHQNEGRGKKSGKG